jgi:hypothetical protein
MNSAFDELLEAVKQGVDVEIALDKETLISLDFSGGYSHERGKNNFLILQKAGVLYQILDDEKYANQEPRASPRGMNLKIIFYSRQASGN